MAFKATVPEGQRVSVAGQSVERRAVNRRVLSRASLALLAALITPTLAPVAGDLASLLFSSGSPSYNGFVDNASVRVVDSNQIGEGEDPKVKSILTTTEEIKKKLGLDMEVNFHLSVPFTFVGVLAEEGKELKRLMGENASKRYVFDVEYQKVGERGRLPIVKSVVPSPDGKSITTVLRINIVPRTPQDPDMGYKFMAATIRREIVGIMLQGSGVDPKDYPSLLRAFKIEKGLTD